MRTRTAQGHVAFFSGRMIRVIHGLRERVAKHRRRFVEADPVFSPVVECLSRRPFEEESAHSREWIYAEGSLPLLRRFPRSCRTPSGSNYWKFSLFWFHQLFTPA